MQITSALNPVYAAADNSQINCVITTDEHFDRQGNPISLPFTATPNDPMSYGQELWAALIAGEYGAIAPYVAPPPSTEGA